MKGIALLLALSLSTLCYSQTENPQSMAPSEPNPLTTIKSPSSNSQSSASANSSTDTQESGETDLAKYIQECNEGNSNSCLILIEGYMKEDKSDEAKKYAQKGCALNNSLACGVLGIIAVTSGNDPKASLTEASEYFDKGCRLGDPTSCKTLADIYKSGIIGEYPKEKIADLYRRSCDIGLAAGCKALEQFEEPPEALTSNSEQK